jgi:M6 family metalloprotease-like protein
MKSFTILKYAGRAAAGIALSVAAVHAMPADPRAWEFTQPDGTNVVLRLRGDEFFHWHEDAGGYSVVRTGDRFVYADLDEAGDLSPTPWMAGAADPAAKGLARGILPPPERRVKNLNGAQKAYQPWAAVPKGAARNITASGTVRNLVILCMFSDHNVIPAAGNPVEGRPQGDYNILFNAVGGHSTLAPTGSVRDAYLTLSQNIVTMQSTVTAWVTLPQTMAYYAGANSGIPSPGSPYPNNCQRMCEDALALVDPVVDFGQFDNDNDGYIDAITFIHSGYGAESNGTPLNSIWSHKWSISHRPANPQGDVWESADNNADGTKVKVNDYHTEPALWWVQPPAGAVDQTGGTGITRIGVICHELGHFFGLPDLYDTDYSSRGVGNWCMMGNSWGFAGDQLNPPHFSAWCRLFLGWSNSQILTTPGTYSLSPAENSSEIVYKVTQGFPSGEYLLIENRQPLVYDRNMPVGPDNVQRGGLAIWHIDENAGGNSIEGFPGQNGWPENGNHYKVSLLQADGKYDLEQVATVPNPVPGQPDLANLGDAGDLFQPWTATQLGLNTVPNTDSYRMDAVHPTGNRISEIKSQGSLMTFRYEAIPNVLFVDKTFTGTSTGSYTAPYKTVVSAYGAAVDGNTILIRGEDYDEFFPNDMNKKIKLESWRPAAVLR